MTRLDDFYKLRGDNFFFKTVNFSGIRTQVVRDECERADHLTT